MENLLELVLLKVYIKDSFCHICTWKAPDMIPSWGPPSGMVWSRGWQCPGVTQQPHPVGFHGLAAQEPFCSQSCDGAVAGELFISHTWLQVNNAPEGPDVSAQVISANLDRRAGCQLEGLVYISLPGSSAARGDLVLGFKSDKISINFPIFLSSCLGSEVEVCKQRGWKRSISKLATNNLFPES